MPLEILDLEDTAVIWACQFLPSNELQRLTEVEFLNGVILIPLWTWVE